MKKILVFIFSLFFFSSSFAIAGDLNAGIINTGKILVRKVFDFPSEGIMDQKNIFIADSSILNKNIMYKDNLFNNIKKSSYNSNFIISNDFEYTSNTKISINKIFLDNDYVSSNLLYNKSNKSINLDYANYIFSFKNVLRANYSNFNSIGDAINTNYELNSYSISENIVVPMNKNLSFLFGIGVKKSQIEISKMSPKKAIDFFEKNDAHFINGQFVAAVNYDNLEKTIFPENGNIASIKINSFVPISENCPSYYKISADAKQYINLYSGFVCYFNSSVEFGNSFSGNVSEYPFFEDLYLGGMSEIRGFHKNGIGNKEKLYNYFSNEVSCKKQQDYLTYTKNISNQNNSNVCDVKGVCTKNYFDLKKITDSSDINKINKNEQNKNIKDKNDEYILTGNNLKILFSTGIVFPKEISFSDDARFGLFFDSGLLSGNDAILKKENIKSSAGLFMNFVLPVGGSIDLNLSYPITYNNNDKLQSIQFAFGIEL